MKHRIATDHPNGTGMLEGGGVARLIGMRTEVDGGGPNNTDALCSACLVAFLVPWMFIPKSHVAGHPSGFSGPLVQLRESNWHAFRLVLTRNTGELFGQMLLFTLTCRLHFLDPTGNVGPQGLAFTSAHTRLACRWPTCALYI